MNDKRKIRVLIVEDSRVNQGLLRGLLADDPGFEIAGIVNNGLEAVAFVAKSKPDVVSMDIYMPVMDGVEATRQIMQHTPVPIVIVSSFYQANEVKMSFSILEAGALTILSRPFGPGHPLYNQTARNYRNTLRMMSEVKVSIIRRGVGQSAKQKPGVIKNPVPPARNTANLQSGNSVIGTRRNPGNYALIAIGASAGGPQAIQSILSLLPSSLPVPVLIVQHIDSNFAEGYCEWLGSTSKLPVHIAVDGEAMVPGHVYLPPGDHHLGLQKQGLVSVSKAPPERGLRPAVSFLLRDVMSVYGKNAMAIILSGMGIDGAAELKKLRDLGAYTFAQDANTSLVHGMPGEAIKLGGALRILPPDEIAKEIIEIFQLR